MFHAKLIVPCADNSGGRKLEAVTTIRRRACEKLGGCTSWTVSGDRHNGEHLQTEENRMILLLAEDQHVLRAFVCDATDYLISEYGQSAVARKMPGEEWDIIPAKGYRRHV